MNLSVDLHHIHEPNSVPTIRHLAHYDQRINAQPKCRLLGDCSATGAGVGRSDNGLLDDAITVRRHPLAGLVIIQTSRKAEGIPLELSSFDLRNVS